jgi:hypothetical protein
MKRGGLKTAIFISASVCVFAARDQRVDAATGTVSARARDSQEGFGLSARLFIFEPLTATIDDPPEVILSARTRLVSVGPIPPGGRTFSLEEGTYILEAHAGGYPRVRTYFHLEPLRELPIVFWLDSRESGRGEVAEARRGSTVFHGHVFDSQSGSALPGASVRLERSGVQTQADGRGYFKLQLPLQPPDSESPARDDLLIEFPGRRAQRHPVVLSEGVTHWIVDLEENERVRQDPSALIAADIRGEPAPGPLPLFQGADSEEMAPFPWRDGVKQYPPLMFHDPPDTLRVGTNCDGTFCPGEVDVVSLETYVKRGLDNEWAPPIQWGAQALRSGAIAYRGYGAYYFYNPLRKNKYDICSAPQCQVYDRSMASHLLSGGQRVVGLQRSLAERQLRLAGVPYPQLKLSAHLGAAPRYLRSRSGAATFLERAAGGAKSGPAGGDRFRKSARPRGRRGTGNGLVPVSRANRRGEDSSAEPPLSVGRQP